MKKIEREICQEVARVVQVDAMSIDPHTPLVEYGLDSLRAMEIIADVEDRFDIETSDIEIAMLQTVADLAAYVEQKRTVTVGSEQ